MSTIDTLLTTDVVNTDWLTKINDNFTTLNTDKAEKSGGTFTGDISVPDEAYWVGWNGSTEVPTKNALYDKIEALPVLSDGDKGDITLSTSGTVWTIDNNVVTNAKLATVATKRYKWRTTAWTGDVEDLTATQLTADLNAATTSLQGMMSAADKTKLDSVNVYPTKVYKTITTATKTNSTGWTTLLTATIPWGVIAASKGIKINTYLNTSIITLGSINTYRVNLAGSYVNQKEITDWWTAAWTYQREVECIILGSGSAAQDCTIRYWWSTIATASSAIDTSSNVTLTIEIDHAQASALVTTNFYITIIESI